MYVAYSFHLDLYTLRLFANKIWGLWETRIHFMTRFLNCYNTRQFKTGNAYFRCLYGSYIPITLSLVIPITIPLHSHTYVMAHYAIWFTFSHRWQAWQSSLSRYASSTGVKGHGWHTADMLNTLRPRQDGRHFPDDIFQTTFSNGFSWMKMCEFRLTFHWSLFLGFQLTIFQHCFR